MSGVCLLVAAGCGGDEADAPPPQPQPPAVAPVHTTLALEGPRELGLDLLPFPTAADEDVESRRRASRGGPPSPVPESALSIDKSSPARLLEGVVEALAGDDLALLARLSRPPGEQRQLSEDDTQAAQERFRASRTRPYWERVSRGIARGAFEITLRGDDRARVRVDVGGAAGVYLIPLRKVGGAWYLAD